MEKDMGVFDTNGEVWDKEAYQLEMIAHARMQTAILKEILLLTPDSRLKKGTKRMTLKGIERHIDEGGFSADEYCSTRRRPKYDPDARKR
jgi:hypothetical protein